MNFTIVKCITICIIFFSKISLSKQENFFSKCCGYQKSRVKNNILNQFVHIRAGSDDLDGEFEKSISSTESEFQIGKDRELFHVSLDIRWLWSKLFNKQLWIQTIRRLFGTAGVVRNVINVQAHAREISVSILSSIRSDYKASTIKFFGGTLPQAQQFAVKKNRFLVVYVESSNTRSDEPYNTNFRKALGDPSIGTILNEQFIFYGSSTAHRSTQQIIKAFGAKEYPYFAVIFVSGPLFKDMEVLAVLKPSADLKLEKVQKFLQRAQDVHGNRLLISKKERERVEAELALLSQQRKEREAAVQASRESAKEEARVAELVRLEAEKKKAEAKRRSDLAKTLPPEPSSGLPDVVAIALKFPTGTRVERRFSNEEPLETVLKWADSVGTDLDIMELAIVTTPKRIFRYDKTKDLKKTLKELALSSSVVVIIQKKKVPSTKSGLSSITLSSPV